MTTTTITTTQNNSFFELRMTIFAGSNQRVAFDKEALKFLGFSEVDFDAVKAMLQTAVLPKEAFNPFFAIRKGVQDYLANKGIKHDLMGRIFNPDERIEIVSFLKKKQEEYMAAKKEFLLNYDSYTQKQIAKVEASASIKGLDPVVLIDAVINHQPNINYYERKLEFRFIDISIELDSEIWAEEIERINSDIVLKTIYETNKQAKEIRDTENPRSKIKAFYDMASKLNSLSFYVPTLKALAQDIEFLAQEYGGLKPAKSYESKESLMIASVAKQIELNAHGLVKGELVLVSLMKPEEDRITEMFSEEQEEFEILVKPKETIVTMEESIPPAVVLPPLASLAMKSAAGAFDF